jgi:hypothetical protein
MCNMRILCDFNTFHLLQKLQTKTYILYKRKYEWWCDLFLMTKTGANTKWPSLKLYSSATHKYLFRNLLLTLSI